MTKLTKVSGYDLSYNGYTNYFGNTSYSGGGNVDGTGSTARVRYIQSVRNDPDINSNAIYFGTGLWGYRLVKVTPNPSNPNQGVVTTIVGQIQMVINLLIYLMHQIIQQVIRDRCMLVLLKV